MTKKGLKIPESPSHSYASLPGLPLPATAAAPPVSTTTPPAAAAAAVSSAAHEMPTTESSPLLPQQPASPLPRRPSASHLGAAPSPGQWDSLDSMSTGSSPARAFGSPGRTGGYRPPGMPGRRSAGPRGGGGGGGGSESSRGQPSRKVSRVGLRCWDSAQGPRSTAVACRVSAPAACLVAAPAACPVAAPAACPFHHYLW